MALAAVTAAKATAAAAAAATLAAQNSRIDTNLGLTQDSGMEGTMKNLTFLARYGGCAIAKKSMCQGGLQIRAWGTTETPPNALPGS